jgi:hypothetical protein
MPTDRWRRIGANLALLAGSAGLVLLILEGAARLYYDRASAGKERNERTAYTEHDPHLGWRKRPGASVTYDRREYRVEVRINSLGERDIERHLEKPPGTFRVLALGDSFVEAYSVALEDSVTRRLEKDLTRPGCPIEVLNAGTGGYGTDQEYLYYTERAFRYEPDVVLLFLYYNDILPNTWRVYWGVPKPLLGLEEGRLVALHFPITPPDPKTTGGADDRPRGIAGSAAFNWVRERLMFGAPQAFNRLAGLGLWEPIGGDGVEDSFKVYKARRHLPDIEAAWHLTDAILRELARQVESHGSRFALAYVPSRMEVSERDWQLTRLRFGLNETWDRGFVLKRVREIGAADGFPVLDLTPELRRAESGLLGETYFRIDGHWNARGHAAAARAVAGFLKDNVWLPPCGR